MSRGVAVSTEPISLWDSNHWTSWCDKSHPACFI